ncbi:uncharacterized protein EV420DRAFT_1495529 [Desarmillaria tabescens]|uniref:Uncharacterized protein n=1 Tax=Armillaria tabescens TaxID=1929756 RepID=A0AA39NPT1_ARMTA|nr:uncharacterized protein EV420DRAFT_1495529 [Desarmillaria tabescens]KAK0469591.1 hypothetical protein EV420DRAFT_1495529 [Desarmillaria tabescens]
MRPSPTLISFKMASTFSFPVMMINHETPDFDNLLDMPPPEKQPQSRDKRQIGTIKNDIGRTGKLAPRIEQCHREMKKVTGMISDRLKEANTKAADDQRRIEELQSLLAEARGAAELSNSRAGAQEDEIRDLRRQLEDLQRERAQDSVTQFHLARVEQQADGLREEKEKQARELEALRAALEDSRKKEVSRSRQIEDAQKLHRRATHDRTQVLEILEARLDEARREVLDIRKQMEELLLETESRISEAENRGRQLQLRDLRALSPKAMWAFLGFQQPRMWWMGSN